ncbi:hypothetical protein VDGL01_07447 [Verticillium dahliae]
MWHLWVSLSTRHEVLPLDVLAFEVQTDTRAEERTVGVAKKEGNKRKLESGSEPPSRLL